MMDLTSAPTIKVEKPDVAENVPVNENPWEVESIYEFYYFNCPTCSYKHCSKQDFVNHVIEIHPESVDSLKKICDGSLSNVTIPWEPENDYEYYEQKLISDNLKVEFNDNLVEENDYENFIEPNSEDYESDSDSYDEEDEKISLKREYLEGEEGDEKSHKCDSCSKSFNAAYKLKIHIRTVHEGHKDFKCDSCGKLFSGAGGLKRHIASVHEGRKDHKCDSCEKSFARSHHLKRHKQRVHEGLRNYMCKCGASFPQRGDLKEHILTIHDGDKTFHVKKERPDLKLFPGGEDGELPSTSGLEGGNGNTIVKEGNKCDSCGKIFSRKEHLKRHVKTVHEGIKIRASPGVKKEQQDHICHHCGKNFARPESLKTHIYTIHEGHRDFKCEKCFKTFTQAPALKKHIQVVHEGIKNHTCEACGTSFAQRGDLKKHIHTVHEGHKDYKCDMCVKAFSDGSSLKRHISSVHEGLKDYNCHSCGKNFSRSHHLKRHIETVHEGHKDHKCEYCGKSFSQKGDMTRHKVKVHEREALQNEFLRGRPPPSTSDERLPTLQRTLPLPHNFARPPGGNIAATLNTTVPQ